MGATPDTCFLAQAWRKLRKQTLTSLCPVLLLLLLPPLPLLLLLQG